MQILPGHPGKVRQSWDLIEQRPQLSTCRQIPAPLVTKEPLFRGLGNQLSGGNQWRKVVCLSLLCLGWTTSLPTWRQGVFIRKQNYEAKLAWDLLVPGTFSRILKSTCKGQRASRKMAGEKEKFLFQLRFSIFTTFYRKARAAFFHTAFHWAPRTNRACVLATSVIWCL